MKEGMGKMGYSQGDMKPKVSDYQAKMSEFAGKQPGKTTEYIERRDRIQTQVAKKIESQAYKGRYD